MPILQKEFVIILFVLFLSTILGLPAKATEQVGAVERISGACLIVRDGQKMDAELNQTILVNDKIRTKAKAEITIRFKDETQLMLGESSNASIDIYVFDDVESNLLFKFSMGTFRAITGKLVEANPEGFNMTTPLSTLGIRGSDVYALVGIGGEEVGVLDLGPKHALEIKTAKQSIRITKPGKQVQISFSGTISPPSAIPPSTLSNIKKMGTTSPPPSKGTKKPTVTPHIPPVPYIPTLPPSSTHPPRPKIH